FNVTLNKQIIYTYTDKPAPARLRRFLDEIYNDMSSGIQLGDDWVIEPTDFQKLQYVAMKLFSALDNNDTNQAEVMSAYLMHRKRELKEICIIQNNDLINMKLI
ncbi:MAG: hypothetical protein QM500_10720, partial [Methylococcales bacterium]